MNRQIDYMINLKLYWEWDSLDESTKKLYEGIHKMNRQRNYVKGFIKWIDKEIIWRDS